MNKGEDRRMTPRFGTWPTFGWWSCPLKGGTQEREPVWGEVANVECKVLAGNLHREPYRIKLWIII